MLNYHLQKLEMNAPEELPAPNLPPVDLERAMDELKCDFGIRQACCALDARVVHMLKCKTEVVALEARQAALDLVEDTEKVSLNVDDCSDVLSFSSGPLPWYRNCNSKLINLFSCVCAVEKRTYFTDRPI